ncbi:MAG TPA: hypothetical protein VFQ53_22835 [Kofleriaceae bacterium]|nr:hypothetical protein [Kofleriaceae bacterium]
MSAGGKLLLVGFAIVLAAGVLLLKFVGGGDDRPVAIASEPMKPVVDEAPAPSPTVTPTGTPPPRTAAIPGAPAATGSVGAATAPTLAPSAPGSADDGVMIGSNGRPIPIASLSVLRAKGAVTDSMIVDCINKYGKTTTGKAVLTFIVGKHKVNGVDKIEVESTGIDDDGTTIQNQDLLECMHKTANAMTFDPSPSSIAVWGKRRITLDNGNITENYIYDYGHIR